jgi:integrase
VPSIKVFLNFDEIEKIKNAKVIDNVLITAKHWLITCCYTGQRVSDLLRMNSGMIFTKIDYEGNKFPILELTQIKTGNDVSIPLHDEVLKILEIYNGNFLPTFGKAKDSNFVLFNRYIKKVCEVAGISNIVKGKVFNEDLKRNEIVETEKYKLVSSHICRRSFATNFYGDKRFTTPQIMAITGHSTESTFLSYIGKTSSDHALQTAKTFREISQQKTS